MQQMWAPWRMEFIKSEKGKTCPFCELPKQKKDADNLILFRNSSCYIIMNRYPYNSGHLLVIPYVHEKDLENLAEATAADLTDATNRAIRCLKKTMKPDGFNIGMNLGSAAGAGIPGHLHYHVIPRWVGDNNFMPVINDMRIINEHLKETYTQLKTELQTTG